MAKKPTTTGQKPAEAEYFHNCLATSTPYPYITVAVKGLVNSGKSTLFNSIFGKHISKSTIQRETMCQVILSERSDASLDITPLKNRIIELNTSMKEEIERNASIDHPLSTPIPEVEYNVPPIMGFFPRLKNIYYRLIETVGFDDHSTDYMNEKWFEENTKWFDILLFVTDKEKCMNNKSEQDLFRKTVHDLKLCRDQGKVIPLVIVINKVDNIQPDDLETMANQCELNVKKILHENDLDDHPCTFCKVSAMKTLNYRLFMMNNNFDHMDEAGISQLAQLELGRQGLTLANSKNVDDREELRQRLLASLRSDTTGLNWQEDCGVNNIVREIRGLINDEALPKLLMGHLNTRIVELEKINSELMNITQLCTLLDNILTAYKCYTNAFAALILSHGEQDQLQRIKIKAIICFRKNCQNYRWSDTALPLVDCFVPLQELRRFDETPSIEHALVPANQWMDILYSIITTKLTTAWGFQAINPMPGSYSPSRLSTSSLSSSTTSSPVSSQSRLSITKIHADVSSYQHAIDMTIDLLSNPAMIHYLHYTINYIFIPIIRGITSTMCERIIHNISLLLYLEEAIIRINVDDKRLLHDIYLNFIQKKIENRTNMSYLGYSIAFKELLYRHEDVRQSYFFEFFPIIHEPVPSCDLKWAVDMMKKHANGHSARINDDHQMVADDDHQGYDGNQYRVEGNGTNISAYHQEVMNHRCLAVEKLFIKTYHDLHKSVIVLADHHPMDEGVDGEVVESMDDESQVVAGGDIASMREKPSKRKRLKVR